MEEYSNKIDIVWSDVGNIYMCGIAGVINLDATAVNELTLESMAAAIVHRGPDGGGIYNEASVGLVHRRLAIIDPDAGHQPMVSRGASLVIVFNGEIYNYIELRKELLRFGEFFTDSDTEVLLRAYEAWGTDCLERLRGMFSFAIYDLKKNSVFLARDRMGIKPLYYCYQPGKIFGFASELSALLPAVDKPEIDPSSVADYLRWQYVPTPKSIYRGIFKLEPGNYLELDLGSNKLSQSCYWHLSVGHTEEMTEEEWLKELNQTLDRVIRMYVRSDVPFGAFLSGGVDSSLVSALMSRVLDSPVRTFSIGYGETKHSELGFAREAARIIGSHHHEEKVSPHLAADLLKTIVKGFGEPFADSSAIPTYAVSAMTAGKVKMVLSGDRGDELFAGYHSYIGTFKDRAIKRLPSYVRRVVKVMAGLLPWGRLRRLEERNRTPLSKHIAQREIFTTQELSRLLLKDFDTDWPLNQTLSSEFKEQDDISRFQYLDAKTYMLDDVLTKVDRMSMANSLEVRVPLLDHEIVELAFRMPLSLKMRELDGKVISKYILKRSTARFFSESFLERPKMGFGIPIVEWCQKDLKDLIDDRFSNIDSRLYEFVNVDVAQGIVKEFYSGQVQLVAKLWTLLMFDLWLEAEGRS